MSLILKKFLTLSSIIMLIQAPIFTADTPIIGPNDIRRLPRELNTIILEQEIIDLDWNTPKEIVESLNTLLERWPCNALRLLMIKEALQRLNIDLNMIAARPEIRAGLRIDLFRNHDINERGYIHDMTPLIYAAEQNLPRVVKFLLGCKVNLNHSDARGNTALMYAYLNHNNVIKELLLNAGVNINQLLLDATHNNQIDIVRSILASGLHLDVNFEKRRSGETSLVNAYKNENGEMMKLLLEAGADIEPLKKYIQTSYSGKYTLRAGESEDQSAPIQEAINRILDWINRGAHGTPPEI